VAAAFIVPDTVISTCAGRCLLFTSIPEMHRFKPTACGLFSALSSISVSHFSIETIKASILSSIPKFVSEFSWPCIGAGHSLFNDFVTSIIPCNKNTHIWVMRLVTSTIKYSYSSVSHSAKTRVS